MELPMRNAPLGNKQSVQYAQAQCKANKAFFWSTGCSWIMKTDRCRLTPCEAAAAFYMLNGQFTEQMHYASIIQRGTGNCTTVGRRWQCGTGQWRPADDWLMPIDKRIAIACALVTVRVYRFLTACKVPVVGTLNQSIHSLRVRHNETAPKRGDKVLPSTGQWPGRARKGAFWEEDNCRLRRRLHLQSASSASR